MVSCRKKGRDLFNGSTSQKCERRVDSSKDNGSTEHHLQSKDHLPAGLIGRKNNSFEALGEPWRGYRRQSSGSLAEKVAKMAPSHEDHRGTASRCQCLTQGTHGLCRKPLESNPEVSFRVRLTRSSLQVDTDPDPGEVDGLYGLLLAEMESISHQPVWPLRRFLRVRGPRSRTKVLRRLVVPRTGRRLHAAIFSGKGCQRGAQCAFSHDVSALTKQQRSERCFNCGSTQHRVADCNAPKPEASGKGGSKGGSLKGGPKQDGKANPVSPPKNPSAAPKTASLAAPSTEPAPELSPKATDPIPSSTQDVRLQTMIAEAHQMLRDLQSGSQAQR